MDSYVLWENDLLVIATPDNPHIAYSEGPHIIVSPKRTLANAWEDIDLASATFELASRICKIMVDNEFAPWYNIQANGNWGLLPGSTLFFHVHIYGRKKTASWGKPIVLPVAPGTYRNDAMPKSDRKILSEALKRQLR